MRRRIVTSTAAIALASVLVLGIPLGLVEAARVRSDATSRLEREADQVAAAIDDRLEAHQPLVPDALARYVRSGHRVVITTRDGRRVSVGPDLRGELTRVRSGSSRGAVVVAEGPASEVHDRVLRAWLVIAALAVGGVAAAVALAFVQARRLARPLESLADTSARLGEGDFSTRAGRFAIPEVDALAHTFDATAARIARLVAREREFSANVSHQLRTPLTALRLRLEELSLRPATEEERSELDAALHELDRLEGTIADLLSYARREQAGEAVEVDLTELGRRHVITWAVLFDRAGRRLELDAGRAMAVRASPGAVGQVIDVLLDNALQHGDGRVRVTLGHTGRQAWLRVEDEGPGVPSATAERIFERGASAAGGTGIGLHLAQVLARAEGGDLRLARPRPPCFELLLPRTTTPNDPPPALPEDLGDAAATPRSA
jgi:signal transduction histidine kinase